MDRKKDRSLVKLYKDLMITKRDLIDLRESINNTINSIKESDQQMKRIEMQRRLRQNSQLYHVSPNSAAPGPPQGISQIKCQKDRSLHQNQKHQVCRQCKLEIKESLQDHLLFSCGQSKLACEVCCSLVKKKELDSHVKICCFRECFKCKKDIYTKAYPFHLQGCKINRNSNLITPCRQFSKNKNTMRPLVIPCCLVVN